MDLLNYYDNIINITDLKKDKYLLLGESVSLESYPITFDMNS